MIHIIDKTDCSGCAACYSICPKDCINMVADSEGFLYPQVNETICTNCGLCDRVCPIIHPIEERRIEQHAYLVQIKNEKIRRESTSGGAFTAIAQWIIQHDGVVFGAAFDENFVVKHRYVDNMDDLYCFRNSKYVQSQIGETFRQIKFFLKKGRWVCFSGTPCQIEGLYQYLQKREYDKLVLIDFVCRAVPSPLLLKKYIHVQQSLLGNKTRQIIFRDKYYGYKYSTFSIYENDAKCMYHRGVETDPYLRAFFSNVSVRPSCYQCKFKKRYRISDFTLWDCFNVADFSRKMDDDKGTTRVLIHKSKADHILKEITDSIFIERINEDKAVQGVREMIESVPYNKKRPEFFNDLNRIPPQIFFNKYFPETLRVRIERIVRLMCYELGIYNQMKKVFKWLYQNEVNQKH